MIGRGLTRAYAQRMRTQYVINFENGGVVYQVELELKFVNLCSFTDSDLIMARVSTVPRKANSS